MQTQGLEDTAVVGRNFLSAIRPWLEEARRCVVVDPVGLTRCIDGIEGLLDGAVRPRTLKADDPGAAIESNGCLARWQMARAKSLVEARLAERLTTADLAAATRLSSCHFARAFKTSCGMTPHQYVTLRRIARAKHLMRTTPAPLAQISLDTGFADQAHFSRVFRRAEGESPSAWRRQIAA